MTKAGRKKKRMNTNTNPKEEARLKSEQQKQQGGKPTVKTCYGGVTHRWLPANPFHILSADGVTLRYRCDGCGALLCRHVTRDGRLTPATVILPIPTQSPPS